MIDIEVIRLLTVAAKYHQEEQVKDFNSMESDLCFGIGDRESLDKLGDKIELLDTAIFVAEQHIEQHG